MVTFLKWQEPIFTTWLNHPFVDGNKRTGVTTALVFLIMNGYELVAEEDVLEKLIMDIASSQVEKEG